MGNESTVYEDSEVLSFRNIGLWFGIAYLVLPALILNFYFLSLPRTALDMLLRFMMFSTTPIGILCLGSLAASLWNSDDRDWPSVDRAFGIFMGIAAATTILSLLFSWGVGGEYYTESTIRLNRVLTILKILLLVCSAAFFYMRPSWAAIPLGLAVLVTLAARIEPDHPVFVQEQKQYAEKAPFYQAVENSFWELYWDTKTPEEVSGLFATLPGEAHSALSSVLREDDAQALLERGDDSAFLEVFGFGNKRGEDGSFIQRTYPAATTEVVRIGHAGIYLYVIALAYALLRGVMAYRERRVVEAPAQSVDQAIGDPGFPHSVIFPERAMKTVMAHVHRFYVEPGVALEGEVELSEQEAHHGLHVLRLREGEEVVLFDGEGREAKGAVSRVDKRALRVAVQDVQEHPRPAECLTVCQAWLNQEKSLEAVVRRGTELGVSGFCFFRGAHSERKPRGAEKWERIAIESCKQCGRVWLPRFGEAADLTAAVAEAEGVKLIATRDRAPVVLRDALGGAGQASCFIGPEGDFSAEEVESAVDAGAHPISLGSHTLRSEVAAATASVLILYELGLLGQGTRERDRHSGIL